MGCSSTKHFSDKDSKYLGDFLKFAEFIGGRIIEMGICRFTRTPRAYSSDPSPADTNMRQ